MEKIITIICFIILNYLIILNFSKIKVFHLNIDKPDGDRKNHKSPTPLAGGLIIFLNIFICFLLINFFNFKIFENSYFNNKESFNIFFVFSFIIFLIGFFDDKIDLSANYKFLGISILIILLLFFDDSLKITNIKFSFYSKNFDLDNYSVFFTIFCFLVYLNAVNMFDGINLQCALYALLILIYISIFIDNSIILNILIISLIFFCYLNYKNKSFLGDSGTLLLGFIISYIFIKLYNLNKIEFADDIVIFMIVPGIDLLRLFIIRILNKKNPLSPDRLHLHHLLMKKFDFLSTLNIMILLILLPILLNYFEINNLVSITITAMVYFSLLIPNKKN